ncbi:MAG: oligoendopeptidase F [Clostridia bacterium]|nr:oligoendopeptidase F [Clostridia bacterium]
MAKIERSEIDQKYKWHLEDIFPSDEAWEDLYFKVDEFIPSLSKYDGRLTEDDIIYECLEKENNTSNNIAKLYYYAKMKLDEDVRKSVYQGMVSKTEMLMVKFSSFVSYITPQLSRLSLDKLKSLEASVKFEDYSVYFRTLIRDKEIILSDKEEKLLSEVGMFSGNSQDVFHMFDDADIKFRPVKDEEGHKVEMTQGLYGVLMSNPSQKVRKDAWESMFTSYKDMINTLSQNYVGNVKKDWFYAKIRGFSSSLDYAMYAEDVPPTCYKKLLEAVGSNTKPLHEYIAFRKKVLNLKTLNMYDLYVPIVNGGDIKLSYEEAVKLVKNALSVNGKEYLSILDKAFNEGWVDVFENNGKRTGAYSWGGVVCHPFVLLNYNESTHEIFTIAHELGHALHTYFSSEKQPSQKADYEIFVAEIASTCNEVLLLKHLLKTAEGETRKYLLSYYLDMFRTTIFRQTMFSEFEEYSHSLIEKGEPVSADILSDKYLELNKKYYGKAVKHNEMIKYEWARIPHFYNSFYVYKYATGMIAAVSIANNILEKGEKYFASYKKFLSAGGSLPPLDILRLAGVDLEKDEPYETAMKEFRETLDELKKLY